MKANEVLRYIYMAELCVIFAEDKEKMKETVYPLLRKIIPPIDEVEA